jgi:hypothetical protein
VVNDLPEFADFSKEAIIIRWWAISDIGVSLLFPNGRAALIDSPNCSNSDELSVSYNNRCVVARGFVNLFAFVGEQLCE